MGFNGEGHTQILQKGLNQPWACSRSTPLTGMPVHFRHGRWAYTSSIFVSHHSIVLLLAVKKGTGGKPAVTLKARSPQDTMVRHMAPDRSAQPIGTSTTRRPRKSNGPTSSLVATDFKPSTTIIYPVEIQSYRTSCTVRLETIDVGAWRAESYLLRFGTWIPIGISSLPGLVIPGTDVFVQIAATLFGPIGLHRPRAGRPAASGGEAAWCPPQCPPQSRSAMMLRGFLMF